MGHTHACPYQSRNENRAKKKKTVKRRDVDVPIHEAPGKRSDASIRHIGPLVVQYYAKSIDQHCRYI